MRPSILIATAVSGILVALGVVALLRSNAPPAQSNEPESTLTGRPPAFHLEATPEQRRAILESSFGKIASDRPGKLGTLKDDIALLMDDPESVRFIVAQWHLRRKEGKYADASFADLFRLVKNKEFVQPTADLLASGYPEIRGKALQAAQTQADPSLGPAILAAYREALKQPENTVILRMEALRAAFSCGGDSLLTMLVECIRDPNPEIAILALTIATENEVAGTEIEAKRVLASSQDRRLRLHAAALVMRKGDRAAQDEIVAALDPAYPGLAAEAAHLVAKYKIAAAAPKLREARPKANDREIWRVLTLALLRLGDREAWDEMVQAADVAGGDGELDALQLLGASGDPNATPILLHALDRGGSARIQAIAAGISTSQEPGMLPVVARLIEQPVSHPAELREAPRAGGQALIPRLAQLLHEATEPSAQLRYLAWLAMIGGKEARDVMIRERGRIRRFADEQIRLTDLEARRLGVEAPPLKLE